MDRFHHKTSMIWIWDGADGKKGIWMTFSLSMQWHAHIKTCDRVKKSMIEANHSKNLTVNAKQVTRENM
jgi:hypothetical protein